MSRTNLDCSALAGLLDLRDVDSGPDLAAVDHHLLQCPKCRAAYAEVAYLRGIHDSIAATPRSPSSESARLAHRPRVLVAAAVLILSSLALQRWRDRGGDAIAPPAADRSSIARVGRVRILPRDSSSVTTIVSSSTGARNSTTRRTIAPELRTK